jgi:hypothetical protein
MAINWTKPIGQGKLEETVADAADPNWAGTKWEYRVLRIQEKDHTTMDAMGMSGWELVSATSVQVGGTSAWLINAIFKRPIVRS